MLRDHTKGVDTLADVAAAVTCHKDLGTKPRHMWETYESYLAPLRSRPVRLVEIGIHRGDSMRTFSAYFAAGTILGLDIQLPDLSGDHLPNVQTAVCDQRDGARLVDLCTAFAPDGADVIIDDASHVGEWSLQTFRALFPTVAKGGLYIIEDWSTGYMAEWGDGAALTEVQLVDAAHGLHRRILSHDFGMVGLVKSLVDMVRIGQVALKRMVFHDTFVLLEKR